MVVLPTAYALRGRSSRCGIGRVREALPSQVHPRAYPGQDGARIPFPDARINDCPGIRGKVF
ncbi:hypothetical protein Taro_000339 [Colocasia esculenta]|uniref:Uncharacterized protein n=1 Tax=Colocasia esculenta TaxID=4460 RepID=A0A843TEZ2_COLES|nr:hypothetical protein [Colocasia esculenta]